MTRTHGWLIVAVGVAVVVGWGWRTAGADSGAATQPAPSAPGAAGAAPGTPGAAAAPGTPSADQVMKDMTRMIVKNPVIEPDYRAATPPRESTTMDPAVLGPAPGEKPVKLHREGEFIVNRKGKLSHAPNSSHILFVFDADSQNTAEPPMILLPCQTLQNMEGLVQERGDRIEFVLSGQITTYRGANYLLPTTMSLAYDKGNLQK